MISYKEFQESVFNWLINKNKVDPSFTFSLRQKANKGSELNYFIGTERSKYFGTTLWTIPVGFPGSSQDLTDVFFGFDDGKLKYYIEFTQTKNPDSKQNTSALNLIQNIKEEIRSSVGIAIESKPTSKMETYKTKPSEKSYATIEALLSDLEKKLSIVIPIVEKGIITEQKKNSSFIAHRINEEEFKNMQIKLKERQRKYAKKAENNNDLMDSHGIIQKVLNTSIDKLPLNQILFGPPGTGKTYNTINKAVSIIDGLNESELNTKYKNRSDLKERFDKLLIDDWDNPNGQIGFITFHQSMSYEDFIEGIKPDVTDNQTVIYDIVPGIFKVISNIARDNWLHAKEGIKEQLPFEEAFNNLKDEWQENQDLKFPLKRQGNDYTILEFTKSSIRFRKASGGTGHSLSISTLRDYYYKRKEVKPTGVGIYYPALLRKLKSYQPSIISEMKEKPYVLIIDEINRGNVSQIFGELITLIEEDKRLGNDEALEITLPYSKEKFGVPPNLYIIGTMNTADRSVEALDTALRRRFSFDEMQPDPELIATKGNLKEHKGFLGEIDLPLLLNTINKRIEKLFDKDHQIGHSYFMSVTNLEELKLVLHNRIIPLLQEYFFGDFGKIGLVLGKGFIESVKTEQENLFADFDDYDASEFAERTIYKLKNVAKLSDDELHKAISLLLKE